jgi:hypothetical protein
MLPWCPRGAREEKTTLKCGTTALRCCYHTATTPASRRTDLQLHGLLAHSFWLGTDLPTVLKPLGVGLHQPQIAMQEQWFHKHGLAYCNDQPLRSASW